MFFFSLLDSPPIRSFDPLQEGILNLLDKFFEMEQQDASRALLVYKDFTLLFERLNAYYRSCKQLMPSGVAFPDLTPLPSDLLAQMQEYVKEAKAGAPEPAPKMAPGAKPLQAKLEGKVATLQTSGSTKVIVTGPVPAAPRAAAPTLIDLLGDIDAPPPAAPSIAPSAGSSAAASNPFGAPVQTSPLDDPFASFGISGSSAGPSASSAAALQQLAVPAAPAAADPFAMAYGAPADPAGSNAGFPTVPAASANPFEQAFVPAQPQVGGPFGAKQTRPNVARDPFGALPGSGFNAPPPVNPVAMRPRAPSPVQAVPNTNGAAANPFGNTPW